jgi:hypothetical protein
MFIAPYCCETYWGGSEVVAINCSDLSTVRSIQIHWLRVVTRILVNLTTGTWHPEIRYSKWQAPLPVPARSGLRSAAAHMLRLWVRIPLGSWMFVWCECCVLSGRSLCGKLTTHPEEAYLLWCVVVCDLECSRMRRQWSEYGRSAIKKNQRTKYPIPWKFLL